MPIYWLNQDFAVYITDHTCSTSVREAWYPIDINFLYHCLLHHVDHLNLHLSYCEVVNICMACFFYCVYICVVDGLPVPYHGQGQYSHQVGMQLTPGLTPNNSGIFYSNQKDEKNIKSFRFFFLSLICFSFDKILYLFELKSVEI